MPRGRYFAGLFASLALLGAAGCADTQAEAKDAVENGSGSKVPNKVTVRPASAEGGLAPAEEQHKLELSPEEWKKRLSEEAYYILREHGTERAFTGNLLDNKQEGYYLCAGCGLPLFASETKFKSGTGWPSFYAPAAEENVAEKTDRSFGMVRTEVLCKRCDGHLGHVFPDGPNPTGLRYCINSDALTFATYDEIEKTSTKDKAEKGSKMDELVPPPEKDVALANESGETKTVLAGGCFWCTEAVFQELKGVKEVVSGYAGGDPDRADYKAVTTGTTGHAEAIEIVYDPSQLTYGRLLQIHFATHDPTTLNRQGNDVGTQYRSTVFYKNEEEKEIAEAYIAQLNAADVFDDPIVTTLEPLEKFFPAEDYHQDFADKNPRQGYVVYQALPKVKKVRTYLPDDRLKSK